MSGIHVAGIQHYQKNHSNIQLWQKKKRRDTQKSVGKLLVSLHEIIIIFHLSNIANVTERKCRGIVGLLTCLRKQRATMAASLWQASSSGRK